MVQYDGTLVHSIFLAPFPYFLGFDDECKEKRL